MRIAIAPGARQTPEDLEAVFREYAPMIYRTARMVTGSPEDAEDIVQTIFLRLLRGEYASRLQGNPRGYLHQAAVNLSLDVLRRRRRRAFIHDVDTLAAPEPSASGDRLAHEQLDAALAGLEFDEASIRPCDPDNLPAAVPGGRGGGGGGSVYMTPGRFYALCMTPATLIRTAYGYYGAAGELAFGTARTPMSLSRGSVATIPDEDGRRVRGGPDWVRTEKYTVEAVARVGDGQDVCLPSPLSGRMPPAAGPCFTANATSMQGPMLLALLERRFGLKARIVTEQAQAFALVVAPGGLRMKEGACTPEQTTSGVVSEAEWARRLMEPVRRSLDAARRGDATPGSCGRFRGQGMADNGPNRILVSEGARVPLLVRTLEDILGERVSDRTGIPGTRGFTYALEFVLDDRTRRNPFRQIATDLVQMAADPSSVPPAPNLFTALEQQLGLRLETAQVPRDYIVIDAIRRPDPN